METVIIIGAMCCFLSGLFGLVTERLIIDSIIDSIKSSTNNFKNICLCILVVVIALIMLITFLFIISVVLMLLICLILAILGLV